MKINSYVGAEGESILIQRPEDLYLLLDWFSNQLLGQGASDKDLGYVHKLMLQVEKDGYGNSSDEVEY